MLAIFVKLIHLVVCLALIVIVLFQADKGEGLAGAFGGGASATLFGERGAETQISKMTTYLAIIFMVTSLIIAVWGPDWEKQAQSSSYVHSTSGNPAPVGQTPVNPLNPMGIPMGGNVVPSVPTAPAPTAAPVTTENPVPVETRTTAPETTSAPTAPAPAPVAVPVTAETTNSPVVVITLVVPLSSPINNNVDKSISYINFLLNNKKDLGNL